jgi:hypothetical protein
MKKAHKRTHAADAANLFVRNLLCEISEQLGGFKEQDWTKTKKYFDNRCAYTGSTKNIVMDHATAHNRTHCGLHLYGNIIPASKEANASKSGKTLEEFFDSDAICLEGIDEQTRLERLNKIKEFQEQSGYQKITKILDTKINIKEFMQKSYQEILNLADEKITKLTTIFEKDEVLKIAKEKSVNEKITKLKLWSSKSNCNHHQIIKLFLDNVPDKIKRGDFIDILKKQTEIKDPYISVSSMMTDAGHAYGKVFMEDDGWLIICPELNEIIRNLKW